MHFQCVKAFQEKHKMKTRGYCSVPLGIQLGVLPTVWTICCFQHNTFLARSKYIKYCLCWLHIQTVIIIESLYNFYVNNLGIVLNNKHCDDYLCSTYNNVVFIHLLLEQLPSNVYFGRSQSSHPPLRNGILMRATETLATPSNDGACSPLIKTEVCFLSFFPSFYIKHMEKE